MAEIKTINGHTLADTVAREGISANAEALETLSEEIEELKEANQGVTITQSGSVIVFDDCFEDTKITVEGEVAEAVTLVQSGKNFAPYIKGNLSDNDVPEYTAQDDGTFTIDGGTLSVGNTVYYWHPTVGSYRNKLLPAGTYVVHTNVATSADAGVTVRKWDGPATTSGGSYLASNVTNKKIATFTLDKPEWCSVILVLDSALEYNNKYYIQIERGTEATAHEKHIRSEHAVNYPTTIDALSGTNVIFDSAGTTLTASYVKGAGGGDGISASTVNALIDAKNKFDPAPFGLPVLYLTGDTTLMSKDNGVELAYTFGEMSGTATVKWQGSSSLAFPKKNYTIKFDNAFEAKEGWGVQTKYCTKANYIDFSHSRNVVGAKLWGQIVASRNPANETLAACPNYGAVDGFPMCIVLNGKYMGVYTFNVPKDGWMMNMGSGTNECILCADLHTDSTKFKAPATLEGDFEIEYVTDESDTSWVLTSLNNLINACIASDGSDLDTTIATMLDWESVIDYYIFISLIRGNDMISKNYLLSTYDGTKWFFGAYDIDSTFGLHTMGTHFFRATMDEDAGQAWNMAQIADYSRVFGLVKTYKTAELKARYAEIRRTVMSEDNVAYVFRNFAGPISRPLLDEDNRKWPTLPNTNCNNVQQILDWYRIRCEYIDAEVEAMS